MTTAGIGAYSLEVEDQIWRISSKRFDPMSTPPRELQGRGRFDDPLIDSEGDPGGYSVLYAAAEPTTAFIEVLNQFRKPLEDLRFFANEMVLEVPERDQLREFGGTVPHGWMSNSRLASSQVATIAPVFDLAHSSAVQMVRERLALLIYAFGIEDVDFSTILGGDRRLTQAISRWIWSMRTDSEQPMFAGIRYRSRFDPELICFALFDGRFGPAGKLTTYEVNADAPGLLSATNTLRLQIK